MTDVITISNLQEIETKITDPMKKWQIELPMIEYRSCVVYAKDLRSAIAKAKQTMGRRTYNKVVPHYPLRIGFIESGPNTTAWRNLTPMRCLITIIPRAVFEQPSLFSE